MVALEDQAFESPHFTLHRLADGVYHAVAREGGAAMSNAGIVDLGDHTLVFDTFLTPQAARDLRAAAERLTGHPVTMAINSHRHADHVCGNQVFEDVAITATERTRDLVAANVAASVSEIREDGPAYIASLETQLAEATTAEQRAQVERELADARTLVASMADLRVTPPNQTFTDHTTFSGAGRTAHLMTYGGGHTESDAFLYLPGERILFAGDLVVIENHPWMGHGNPAEWDRILDQLAALDIATVAPGHGPVGARDALDAMRRYLADIQRIARDGLAMGQSTEELAATPVPAQYATYAEPGVFANNLRFLAGKRFE